jgi:hypothetical protein
MSGYARDRAIVDHLRIAHKQSAQKWGAYYITDPSSGRGLYSSRTEALDAAVLSHTDCPECVDFSKLTAEMVGGRI